jgi:uncharacterized protein YjbI with pentapeptide repeats
MAADTEHSAADSEEQASRVPRRPVVLAVLALAGVVVGVIVYGYLEKPGWIGVSGKKFWDYLELLIVPAALAIGVYLLNRAQQERERKAEDAQHERELAVESQRAQDEALQAYLDQMSSLLLEKDLRNSEENSEVRTLARARTLTVLGRLDKGRKNQVLGFLREADLVRGAGDRSEQPIIKLDGADLRGVGLYQANLRRAHLKGAELGQAFLMRADLSGAFLIHASLHKAKLRKADLKGAFLTDANLKRADLREADLGEANLLSGDPPGLCGWLRPERCQGIDQGEDSGG